MKKYQTIEEIYKGIETTIKEGINPGLNVLFGNIGDTRDSVLKIVDFLKKYNLYGELRTLKPVTPYPGSELYYHAIKQGLIRDCEDFYEIKHMNSDLFACNFTELDDEQLCDILYTCNKKLIEDHFKNIIEKNITAHKKLYFEKDYGFRGVRH